MRWWPHSLRREIHMTSTVRGKGGLAQKKAIVLIDGVSVTVTGGRF